MGRVNTLTKGVFMTIFGGEEDEISNFVNLKTTNPPSKELEDYLTLYTCTIHGTNKDLMSKELLGQLTFLEEIIIQLRIKENLTPEEIKFNLVRNYIYARVPFPRSDTRKSRDIRTIVGTTENWGKAPWKNKSKKETFLNEATKKLMEAMSSIITQNMKQFEEIVEK